MLAASEDDLPWLLALSASRLVDYLHKVLERPQPRYRPRRRGRVLGRGQRRQVDRTQAPTRSVDALVRERTSPAVKSALQSLLEAPVATRTGKKTKKGKANA
jgi:hypothetical protein